MLFRNNTFLIPDSAKKPIDARVLRGKNYSEKYIELFMAIDVKKVQLNKHRPLTKGELRRLREEFLIEFIYSSNAIEGNTLTLQETAMVLDGITIDQKPLKDHLEAVGHRDAFYISKN